MPQKKRNPAKKAPEHTIKLGEVAVDVFLGRGNAGNQYRGLTPRKSWTNDATGRESSGTVFFESDQDDLHKAVDLGFTWIRDKNSQASGQDAHSPHRTDTEVDHQQDLPDATVEPAHHSTHESDEVADKSPDNDISD